ncbi:hypothetical protein HK104_006833 [Borealophlyctis nickersoniae]|nr:hypothetical protein HK104_006833 [Borealophlyctis nickersoniae]
MPPQKRKAQRQGATYAAKKRRGPPRKVPGYASPTESDDDGRGVREMEFTRSNGNGKGRPIASTSSNAATSAETDTIIPRKTKGDEEGRKGVRRKQPNAQLPPSKEAESTPKNEGAAEEGEDEGEEGEDLDMLDEEEDLDRMEEGSDAEGEDLEMDGVKADEQTGPDGSVSKSAKLANAIAKILAADTPGADKQRPILSKEKHIERSIDEAKLDAKARKLIANEKREKADVGRVLPTHTTTDYEKKLRKVATRGVVKLFNAIRVAQNTAEEVKSTGIQKNAAAAPIISKNTFLDMLKGGPKRPSQIQGSGAPDVVPEGGSRKQQKIPKGAKEEGEESVGVSWAKKDYMMKTPKHWDEGAEEEDPELA